ncbi:HYR domain-containing protein, partial [Flavobacterium sp. GB2R13]|uniref:HYR domain-containing protein n=1 Tax=Flavobacterium algoris TaxID=3398733 RepID=UPI003A8687D8
NVVLGTPVTADNCHVASVTNDAPSAFPIGITTVTWTVTDNAGNSAVATQTVTVSDNMNPTITAPTATTGTTNVACTSTNVALGTPVTADNCHVASVTNDAPSAFPIGITTVTWTVTDDAGNSAAATQTVTVSDTQKPILTVVQNQNVNLNASCSVTIPDVRGTATDNCTGTIITQSPVIGSVVSSSHNGTINVLVTVTDAAGLTDVKTVVLTAKDVIAPVLIPAANQNVNLNASCSVTIPDVRGTATDNCTGTIITQSPVIGSVVSSSHNGTINVLVTVTDAAGLTDVKTVVLTAKDVIAPVLIPAANQNVNLNASCSVTIPDVRGTVMDNCIGAIITQSPSIGSVVSSSHNGTINVLVTATDAAGLTDVKIVVLMAKDVIAPGLIPATNQNVNLNASCSVTIPDVRGAATDNCTGTIITQSPVIGSVVSSSHNGTINVVVTATDAAGLTDVKTVVLTAKDVIAPVLIPAANQNVNLNTSCSVTIPDVRGTATDNCTGTIITQSPVIGSVVSSSHNGTINVLVTATDAAGLTDVKTVVLTAKDVIAPVLIPAANQNVNLNASCSVTIPDVRGTATDNCIGTIITQSPSIGSVVSSSHNGTINVLVTARDAAGLTDVKTVVLTAKDVIAPVLIPAANQNVNLNASCSVTIPDVRGTATDNCTGTIITQSPVIGSVVSSSHNGTINVLVTARDAAGLTDVKTVVLTAKDVIAPVLIPAANQNVNLNASCSVTIPDVRGIATDNCTGTIITQSPVIGSVVSSSHNGTINVQITATDAAGNTAMKTVVLTAKDITPPTIVCPVNIILSACQSIATWSVPVANDNCIVTVAQTAGPVSGSTFAPNTVTTITYTATDTAGNQNSCSFTVTRVAVLNLVVVNSNPQLYYGYTLDQSSVITGTPSGGVGPYTVSIAMNRPLNGNVITSSGDEIWTPGANTFNSSNHVCPVSGSLSLSPISTSTNTIVSNGNYSVTATLMANAIFTVTVTDKNGCSVSKTTTVYSEDDRCFAGNSGNAKVKICHRTGNSNDPCHELCVDQSAVQAHLDHGDYIGSCLPLCAAPTIHTKIAKLEKELVEPTPFDVIAYPNPTDHQFTLIVEGGSNEKVEVLVYDSLGRMVKYIDNSDGQQIKFGEGLPSGAYIAIVSQGINQKTVRLIKE